MSRWLPCRQTSGSGRGLACALPIQRHTSTMEGAPPGRGRVDAARHGDGVEAHTAGLGHGAPGQPGGSARSAGADGREHARLRGGGRCRRAAASPGAHAARPVHRGGGPHHHPPGHTGAGGRGEWVAGSAGDPSIEAAIRQASGITEALVIPASSVGETFTPTSAHAPSGDRPGGLSGDHGMLQPDETCYAGAEATGAGAARCACCRRFVRGSSGWFGWGPACTRNDRSTRDQSTQCPRCSAFGGQLREPSPRCADACRWADLRTAVSGRMAPPAGATRKPCSACPSHSSPVPTPPVVHQVPAPTEAASGPAVGPPVVLCFAPRASSRRGSPHRGGPGRGVCCGSSGQSDGMKVGPRAWRRRRRTYVRRGGPAGRARGAARQLFYARDRRLGRTERSPTDARMRSQRSTTPPTRPAVSMSSRVPLPGSGTRPPSEAPMLTLLCTRT